MALPAKLKTWQHDTNLDGGFHGTDSFDQGALFVLVKNAMKGFALNPWTCEGSSDSVTAGMDAADRLTDYTKVVRGGGVHAWIVLEQDASGTPWQVLFDFASGDARQVYIYMSPSVGFSGGSTSARPTAADEIAIVSNPVFFVSGYFSAGEGFSARGHVMQSTDGLSTRIVTCQGNVARFFLFIEKPIDPPTGWTNPVVMGCYGDDQATPNDPMSINRWSLTADIWRAVGPISAMNMNATMKGFATNGTSNGVFVGHTPWTPANEASGQFPLSGVGVAHITTVGQRGRHGYFADLYHTSLAVLQGNSFPGDGSKGWVVFGNMVLPWDGGDVEMG